MAECEIHFKVNGKDVGPFKSDRELDSWIYDNLDSLSVSGKDLTFSLNNEQEDALKKVNEAHATAVAFKSGAVAVNNKRAVYSTPTRFTKHGGDPTQYGDVVLWTKPMFHDKKKDTTNNGDSEEFRKLKTDIGHDFDSLMEVALNLSKSSNTTVLKFGSTRYNSMLNIAMQVAAKLKRDHPDAIFRTQHSIASGNLSSSFIESLRLAMSTADPRDISNGSANEINSFYGDPDLIVIDKDGSVSIYDFKTSEYPVTVENHREYATQIACYAQMLKQRGVKIKNVALIPVQISYVSRDANAGESVINETAPFILHDFSELRAGDKEIWGKVEKWFPTTEKISAKSLDDVTDVLKVTAPNTSITKQAEFKMLTLEMEVKQIYSTPENNPERSKGNIWAYQCVGARENEDKYLYDSTKEGLSKKIEKWIDEYNKRAAETYSYFAKDLRKALSSKDIDVLADVARVYNPRNPKYIVTMFRRYLNNWTLISDDILIANGLFLFKKADSIELVVLDSRNPYAKINWDHPKSVRSWTTILGAFKADDEYVDKRWVLPNYQGNLAMIKGLIFLSQHPELFKDAKLNKVSSMCLNKNAILEESLEKLVENYKLFSLEYQKQTGNTLNILTIGKEVNTDAKSFVSQALDLLETIDNKDVINLLTYDPRFKDLETQRDYSIEEIQKMINALRYGNLGEQLNKVSRINFDSAAGKALEYLYRAFLSKINYQISAEERTGTYSDKGFNLNGLYATSFADSHSAIARTLHEATYSFTRICQDEFVRYTAQWKKLVAKFYEENGFSNVSDASWNLFERFFQHENGKISSKFMLKQRGTMSTRTENEILDMFYDALDRYQYYKGFVDDKTFLDNKNSAIQDGTYGEVPLIKANLVEGSEKLGSLKAIVEKAKTDWNILRDFLLGVDVSDSVVRELDNIDLSRIPALVFEREGREQKLNESEDAVNKYTTDLDFIFNMIVAQGIRRARSPQMMMTASAIRAVLAGMIHFGLTAENGANVEETRKAIDDYVKDKLFNRPIMNESEHRLSRIINGVKSIASFITLSANFRALTREMITDLERCWVRFSLKPEYKQFEDFGGITLKNYTDAVNELITQCKDNANVMAFHMQLNALYGTANFSYDQMAEASKIGGIVLKELQLSDMYFTATWPDFIHRNAIIIAYLKGIGAYDAYSIKDGILTYDMSKDKRFDLFNKYRKREDVPISEISRWDKQYRIYKDEFDSWNNNGYRKADGNPLVEGDDLPQALSPRKVMGLKDISDRLFGNYDKETKSLMMKQLLGSMFFQFRTYGLMRLREIFDGGGSTSDIRMVPMKIKNKDGKEEDAWLLKEKDLDAVERGEKMYFRIVPRSEVTNEDIKNGDAYPARYPSSYYSSPGTVQTLVDLGASLFWHKNQEEFEHIWNTCPDYKANVMLFMIDTFGMLLLALFIQAMYGEALSGDYDEVDWLTKWSYNVAIGVTQDGPVWQVVSSVIGNGAPPMLGVMKSFSDNAWSIITGKRNFLEGVANAFGATRELAYLFHVK